MKNLRCYAKISITNLLHNFDCVKSLLPHGCEIMPIIKANAYSHGSVEIAKALSNRVTTFAVAEMDEALLLRENGIKNNLLVLGYTDPSFATLLSDSKITQTVTSLEYAKQLSKMLGDMSIDVHVKLDTGMHRLGFDTESGNTVDEITQLSKIENINISGVFSHFAESDCPQSDFTDLQFSRFTRITDELKAKGIELGTLHIANSSAILDRPETHLSAVRPGIVLYGAYPSPEIKERYLLEHPEKPIKEVMTLCARVGQVHCVRKGEAISYSRTHTFERDSVIAVVTAGYADGIPRTLSNNGRVKINGEVFNIVGNVCMDFLMVDITDAKCQIKAGDEVVFWGSEGISIDEYAQCADTISYTLYTGISPRVAKIYE